MVPLRFTATPRADKDTAFEIDRAYNLYNVLYKPTKTVLLQYDSDEDQLIAVNAVSERSGTP